MVLDPAVPFRPFPTAVAAMQANRIQPPWVAHFRSTCGWFSSPGGWVS